jgi:hypothetical protein
MNVADITPPRTATPASTVSITPNTPIGFLIGVQVNTPTRPDIIIGVYDDQYDVYAWNIQPRSILQDLLAVLEEN